MGKRVGSIVLAAVTVTGLAAHQLRAGQAAPAGQTAQAGQAARGAAPQTPPCGPNLPAEIKNVAKDSRCFELRTYTVREGSSIEMC